MNGGVLECPFKKEGLSYMMGNLSGKVPLYLQNKKKRNTFLHGRKQLAFLLGVKSLIGMCGEQQREKERYF